MNLLDKKYPNKKTFTRDEVIEYTKELDKGQRQSDVLLGQWKERKVRKHEGDIKHNIKNIHWKVVLIMFGVFNIGFPIVGGLIYSSFDDFLDLLKVCIVMSFIMLGLPILHLIFVGREEIEQTTEDYIENGPNKND